MTLFNRIKLTINFDTQSLLIELNKLEAESKIEFECKLKDSEIDIKNISTKKLNGQKTEISYELLLANTRRKVEGLLTHHGIDKKLLRTILLAARCRELKKADVVIEDFKAMLGE